MLKHSELIILGQAIRRRREALGFSQDTFAIEHGIGRAYYGRIERGEANVATMNLIKIAKALKSTIADLFSEIDNEIKQNIE